VTELRGFRLRGTGHAPQLLVHAEVVLQSDGRECLVLFLDAHAFLGLDRLVEAFGVTTSGKDAAGELVDDLDLAVLDHVLDVALVELLRLERGLQVVDEVDVHVVVQVLDAEDLLDLRHALLADRDRALLLVEFVVLVLVEPRRDAREVRVPLDRTLNGTRDDQRRSRLVDQDRVHLVDDRHVMTALREPFVLRDHVVAEVVEAELVVRPVGHIGRVRGAPFLRSHLRLDQTGVETEEAVDLAHPLGVTFGEVVVDRDDVHSLAPQSIEVDGKRCGKRLSFTGPHLGDPASVERRPTHQLHVEVALADRTIGCLTGRGEGLGEEIVEELATLEALLELGGFPAEVLVGQGLVLVLVAVNGIDDALEELDLAALAGVQNFINDAHGHPL
jgi:hypothetical protein